jgi:chemotaxis protein CheX
VDLQYINPFVEGLDSVFKTMLSVQPKRRSVKLSKASDRASASLTTLVGFSGQHVHGVVVLRFPPSTALQLVSRMLSAEIVEVNDEVIDAISEIVNMVAGSAKAKIQCDPPLELGLPTVVQGSEYKVNYPSGTAWLEVPFESEAGEFTMELTLEIN